jgi:hypothetical protein
MTDHVFQDWMDAATDDDRPTTEADIVSDYIGCKEITSQEHSGKLANGLAALDLGVYHLPNLLRDMQPYLTEDSDLITVARGLYSELKV